MVIILFSGSFLSLVFKDFKNFHLPFTGKKTKNWTSLGYINWGNKEVDFHSNYKLLFRFPLSTPLRGSLIMYSALQNW